MTFMTLARSPPPCLARATYQPVRSSPAAVACRLMSPGPHWASIVALPARLVRPDHGRTAGRSCADAGLV